MKILHLTLKRKWFDMILSGEKSEEYREIKPYWIARMHFDVWNTKPFDLVIFKNGYSKNAREMTVEFNSLSVGLGKTEWGGGAKEVFIISLGKILETKNLTNTNN
jgi:hypothetical protein